MQTRATFDAAARSFLDLVEQVPPSAYDGPGLGDWDLRALVGHAGRSLVTVATYLGTRADSVAAATPAEYFAVASRLVGRDDDGAIARRGVEAGRALGDDPVGALRASYAAATAALDGLDGADPVVETAAGGMRVSDYLPTRTFELVVHSLDIARACGVAHEPPADALAEALGVAAASAVELGLGPDVLLALTGREPLAAGTSVVP
ncbi:maleylpyruvate isomerase family mycothiol-dependent enzyme [Nocardioides sp.]|uniref:maleylpyruvate isomerase family mycothiol-dependent enzyme n=1 Tax=Nocardioides sp. TaxID=35761 RepID=UPI0037851087